MPPIPQDDASQSVEDFVADVQLRLHNLMLAKGVDHAELAARLCASEADIDALFGDRPGLSMERLAEIFHALGERPAITSPTIERLFAAPGGDAATPTAPR